MRDIIISGTKINPGETVSLNIPIAHLPIRSEVVIPVNVYRGIKPGPVLLLMGGIHGDELTGVEIVRKMIAQKEIKPEAGTVIAIPVVNLFGFLHKSREFPDGRDLNRSFPGSKEGSLASQVAYVIMNEIVPYIDAAIDFHSGGGKRYNVPQIRCHIDNDKELEMAKVFGADFIVKSSYREKSFREKASILGKSTLVYEGGESLRFDHDVIEAGIEGALRILDHMGIQKKESNSSMPISKILSSSKWIRAKMAGLFRSFIENGSEVHKRQVIGSISDPFGEKTILIKAGIAGYVIGINHLPIVNKGDAIIHIGSK